MSVSSTFLLPQGDAEVPEGFLETAASVGEGESSEASAPSPSPLPGNIVPNGAPLVGGVGYYGHQALAYGSALPTVLGPYRPLVNKYSDGSSYPMDMSKYDHFDTPAAGEGESF